MRALIRWVGTLIRWVGARWRLLWRTRRRTCVLLIGLDVLFACYLAFFNYTEQYEVGIAWNQVTGNLWLQNGGMHLTPPWVAVSRVDTRPQRVCITSDSRAFNCKLVRFVPGEFQAFIAAEGHRYFWWANRFSFNGGYKEEYRGMRDILRGYAYSAAPFPFVQVTQEMQQ